MEQLVHAAVGSYAIDFRVAFQHFGAKIEYSGDFASTEGLQVPEVNLADVA